MIKQKTGERIDEKRMEKRSKIDRPFFLESKKIKCRRNSFRFNLLSVFNLSPSRTMCLALPCAHSYGRCRRSMALSYMQHTKQCIAFDFIRFLPPHISCCRSFVVTVFDICWKMLIECQKEMKSEISFQNGFVDDDYFTNRYESIYLAE